LGFVRHALALLAIGCYKIGYQRCRDASSKGVVFSKTRLNWQELLVVLHYKASKLTMQHCVIANRPETLRTEEDLRQFVLCWGRYARALRIEASTFLEEDL